MLLYYPLIMKALDSHEGPTSLLLNLATTLHKDFQREKG